MKKILILNTYHHHGGTIALSRLCKCLIDAGIDASLVMNVNLPWKRENVIFFIIRFYLFQVFSFFCLWFCKVFRNYKFVRRGLLYRYYYIPVKGCKYKHSLFYDRENTIVIYPDAVYGNPLNAKYVVRWLLFHYRYKNQKGAYSKDDLFICYRDFFNDKSLNPQGYKVNIMNFDSELYQQTNFDERVGNCYIARKGKLRPDFPSSFDGPVIDSGMSEEEIVDILNNSKFCYSYDTQTFYTTIAAVCGCIPVVVLEEGKTERDYLGIEEKHYGIAYGDSPDQIQYAIKTRDRLLKTLDYRVSNKKEVDIFISILNERFES